MFGRRELFRLAAATVVPNGARTPARTQAVQVDGGPAVVAAGADAVFVGCEDGRVTVLGERDVPTAGAPTGLVVDEARRLVYAVCRESGTIGVVAADGRPSGLLPALPGAAALDLDTATGRLFAVSATSGRAAVVDPAWGLVEAVIDGPGRGFGGIQIDRWRRVAYLTSPGANTVEVLDLARYEFVASIPVGIAPTGLALHLASNTVYVANSGIHHLSVVDGNTRRQRAKILLRSEGSTVAVHQASHTVYTNGGPDGIVRIDGATETISGELPLGVNPAGIAVDQRSGLVYVADPVHNRVFTVTLD